MTVSPFASVEVLPSGSYMEVVAAPENGEDGMLGWFIGIRWRGSGRYRNTTVHYY